MDIQYIKAARLIDGSGGKVIENPVVVIKGERISEVRSDTDSAPSDGIILDLGSKTLLPGLIDCHLHYGIDPKGNIETDMLRKSIPFLAIQGASFAKDDLYAGITTVRAAGDKGFLDVAMKEAVNKGIIEGPRMAVSGHMLTITGGRDNLPPEVSYSESLWKECDGADGVRKAAREQLKYGVDWIKLGASGAVSAGGGLPGGQQFTLEEIRAAVECAKMYGKKTFAHAHSAATIKACVAAGVDSIEHGLLIDEEAVRMMADKGVYWCLTNAPIENILNLGVEKGIPASMVERTKGFREEQLRMIRKGRELGIKFVMGTDSGMPFVYHGENPKELEYMVRVCGFSPMEAILSSTSAAAGMLGWENDIGSVEPGRYADIIGVDEDPLKNISTLQNVSFVMKSGKIIKNNP